MALRTGTTADVPAVLALWSVATTIASTTDDAPAVGALLERSPDALVLAVDDGTIVGTVIAAWDGWRGAMYRLAVLPSHRRRGIATQLVTEGERRLLARGVRRLHMIVESHEAPAHAFWLAMGYRQTDQHRYVKSVD